MPYSKKLFNHNPSFLDWCQPASFPVGGPSIPQFSFLFHTEVQSPSPWGIWTCNIHLSPVSPHFQNHLNLWPPGLINLWLVGLSPYWVTSLNSVPLSGISITILVIFPYGITSSLNPELIFIVSLPFPLGNIFRILIGY